jgi:hypothetical protein
MTLAMSAATPESALLVASSPTGVAVGQVDATTVGLE